MSNLKKNEDSFVYLVLKVLVGILFLPLWWLQKIIPRKDNLWIFGAWQGINYSDNSRALFEYVSSNIPNIETLWITKSANVYQQIKEKGLNVAKYNSWKGIKHQLMAKYIFISWGKGDVNYKYCNGAEIIQLWHGMPLKQIGEDETKFKHHNQSQWKKFKTCIRKICLPYEFIKWEYTISNSEFFTPFLKSAFKNDYKNILETGSPRNDKLFSSFSEPLIQKINKKFSTPFKILYMPTWRDYEREKAGIFNPFKSAGFDANALSSFLETSNSVFIYKGHFINSLSFDNLVNNDRFYKISELDYDDLYTLIKDVDLLITDYSSIYFDFLLCKKPIILFPFDQEEYTKHSRPFYFDYNLLKASRVYNWEELIICLKEKAYTIQQDDECRLFNKYCDGKSSERIFNKVIKFNNQ